MLSVGGIAGYSKAMMKYKINKTLEQVTQIATNIPTLYAQQTTYEGLYNATAVNMGIIPDELGTEGNVLTNAFGGSVISLPVPVSVAAEACDCGSENDCAVNWLFE